MLVLMYGCWAKLDYQLWNPGREIVDYKAAGLSAPISKRLDGGFLPGARWLNGKIVIPEYQPLGSVRMEYMEGWTILGMYDRAIDPRPNAHTTFLLNRVVSYEQAVGVIGMKFADIWKRLPHVWQQVLD